MKSPVFAIAFCLWSRHRVGFVVAAGMLVTGAILFPFLASVTPAGTSTVVGVVPVVGVFAFVLNSLLFVQDAGSLSSRYPRFMLALPVRTRTLVFWPMMFATASGGLLLTLSALLIYRPAGYQIPVLIPALALAGLMAWAQAAAWMPIQPFWLREFATIILVVILGALGAFPIWLTSKGPGWDILAALVLLLYIVVAFFVAGAAVASDRHGIAWRFWPAHSTLARFARLLPLTRPRRPFRSAFDAQLSYEWGCHGLMLNGFVIVSLFVIWAILLLKQGHGTPQWLAIIFALLPIVLVTTIAATGPGFGRLRPFWVQTRGIVQSSTFIATRPMTTARLVGAKFRMAAASVLLNWTLAVTGTTCWLIVSDNLDNAAVLARDFFSIYPGGRGVAVIVLTCILLPALSWRFLTGALAPVLTGRRWVADGAVWLYLSFLAAVGGCGFWLAKLEPSQLNRFSLVIPFLVLAVGVVKGAAALAGFRNALKRGLMSWRDIGGVLALWFVLTACGIALAILIGPFSFLPVSLPIPILALGVASLVPLARFPLATLALDWNRHR